MKSLAVFALCLVVASVCHGQEPKGATYERQFHDLVPLGAERIDLHPADRELFILATAESPVFEGWRATEREHGSDRSLVSADGTPVRFYPRHVDFRLTATAMRPKLLTIDSYATLRLTPDQINNYILGLRFRMLIFHGLDITRIEPDSVRMIGMPADEQYDERTWLVSFNTPRPVSTNDHIVLEVLSPTGYRVCKFHLDFF